MIQIKFKLNKKGNQNKKFFLMLQLTIFHVVCNSQLKQMSSYSKIMVSSEMTATPEQAEEWHQGTR